MLAGTLEFFVAFIFLVHRFPLAYTSFHKYSVHINDTASYKVLDRKCVMEPKECFAWNVYNADISIDLLRMEALVRCVAAARLGC